MSDVISALELTIRIKIHKGFWFSFCRIHIQKYSLPENVYLIHMVKPHIVYLIQENW